MRRCLILPVILLCSASGCVRAGFRTTPEDASPDDGPLRDGRREGTQPGDTAGGSESSGPRVDTAPAPHDLGSAVVSPVSVTSANNTCASPAVVDLAPLSSGAKVSFTVSTIGATHDYSAPGCGSLADVVVKLVNAPAFINWTCAGNGMVTIAFPFTSAPCELSFTSSSGFPCMTGGTSSLNPNASTAYILICRDPVGGTATITLW
jgi:hypothetical protein